MITLENPRQSSDLSDLYLADNALNRQNKVENEASGKNWTLHPFLKQKKDDFMEGRFTTSCSITKPVSDDQKTAWWEADFVDGNQDVSEVRITGEIYKVLWDRYYMDASVYVDDQLCGVIN